MNGAAMGLLGGFGRGVSMVADDMQKSNLFAQQEQAAMAREQRIEEAAIAREGRQEQYNINSEKRGIENSRVKAQNEIDLKTDPNNINKLTQAELTNLKAKDDYKFSRVDEEIAAKAKEQAALTKAKYDNMRFAGDGGSSGGGSSGGSSSHGLSSYASGKVPPVVSKRIQYLEGQIRNIDKIINDDDISPQEKQSMSEVKAAHTAEIESLFAQSMPAEYQMHEAGTPTAKPSNLDPLQLGIDEKKPAEDVSVVDERAEQVARSKLAEKIYELGKQNEQEFDLATLTKLPASELQALLKQLNLDIRKQEKWRKQSIEEANQH